MNAVLAPFEWELLSCWWQLELLVCYFKMVCSFIYSGCLSLAFGCYFHWIFLFLSWRVFLLCFCFVLVVRSVFCGPCRWNLLPGDELKWTRCSSEFDRFTREHVRSYRLKTISSTMQGRKKKKNRQKIAKKIIKKKLGQKIKQNCPKFGRIHSALFCLFHFWNKWNMSFVEKAASCTPYDFACSIINSKLWIYPI